MIRFRPLLVMSILSIIALAVLLALGRWQWEKYEQKTAAAEEPVAEMTIASYQPVPDGIQFVHGVRPDTHEQGWRVFAPVQYGDTTVFVDADFIPEIEIDGHGVLAVPDRSFLDPRLCLYRVPDDPASPEVPIGCAHLVLPAVSFEPLD